MIRVVIADDDTLVREGLRVILSMEADLELLACLENGKQVIDYRRNHEFDLALLDVRMPILDGIETARSLSDDFSTKSLILTTFDDEDFIVRALKSGAGGYLLKSTEPAQIKNAIRMVVQGGNVWQNSAVDVLRRKVVSPTRPEMPPGLFSDREGDVMRLIAKGYSNKQIADELFMSEGTVKNHVTAILDKTGLEHRTQIAIYVLTGSSGRDAM